MKRERDNRPWIIAGITLTALAVAAAIAIVQRMSNESVAVLAGAFCGVGASIPTSLLIVWITTRERESQRRKRQTYSQGVQMPSIILQQPPQLPPADPYRTRPTVGSTLEYSPPREFTVVGDE